MQTTPISDDPVTVLPHARSLIVWAFTSVLSLVGCVSTDALVSTQALRSAACLPDVPYAGSPLRAAPTLADSSSKPIDWTAGLPPGIGERLDEAWSEGLMGTDASVASVVVVGLDGGPAPSGVWTAYAGPSDGPRAFWWASVGKMVTAAAILQMEREGRLSLGDTIDRWFPDFPGAATLRVDHLLTHTGGVHSFDRDARLRDRRDYVAPDRLVAASVRQGIDFCPGTNWFYSNTGYVMLARIAERVDGEPFARIVERRIAGPLGLRSVRTLGPATDPTSLVAPVGRPEGTIKAFATIGGAGPVAGDARDMVRLLHAWMGGRLVGREQRNAALARLHPMFGSTASYGRGVMVVDVPDEEGGTVWIGHLGGSPDAKALLAFDVRRNAYVGLLLNTDADGEALALRLLQVLHP